MLDQQAMAPPTIDALARRLLDAAGTRSPIPPLTETAGLDSEEDAYAIQRRLTELRLGAGDEVIGHKIGLTSRAMQEQLGVSEPDYGSLWGSRYFHMSAGRTEMPFELFLQPRVEGELAFLIGAPLPAGGCDGDDVLAATAAVAPSIEVIDSRIEDWRIRLEDTVADNASYGAFTLGPWSTALRDSDLTAVRMVVSHDGVPVVDAIGAAVLGHPARSVAWLANKLATFGVRLRAGDVVLSGALGRSIPAAPGDVFTVATDGQPDLTVEFR